MSTSDITCTHIYMHVLTRKGGGERRAEDRRMGRRRERREKEGNEKGERKKEGKKRRGREGEERRKRCWWIAKMELGEGLVHLSYEYLPTCR